MKELSLHILDIIQNSITAEADLIEIELFENIKENIYSISVKDNGKGMTPEMLSHVTDPYCTSRTTRKVGMGIPLLKQNAERAGGSLSIYSELGKGCFLKAIFQHNNIDRAMLGDIAGVIVLTAATNENIRFIYTHKTDVGEYVFDTKEIKEAMDGMSIKQLQVIKYLKDMIRENLTEIQYSN
ncbi:MAG: sensor histidine kinase [Bacteroidetes bacterium]|nr:sensor histidine kinase [Bacteroidota bacterium]